MSSRSIILSKDDKNTSGTIRLTGSKSESNRALILNALSKGSVAIENLSSADDTKTLHEILERLKVESERLKVESERLKVESEKLKVEIEKLKVETFDVGPAGTAMRFLTSYFAVTGQEIILTGTKRMKERPIGLLANALKDLGAEIDYAEKEGFPPLKFNKDFQQKEKHIKLKGDVSSQYITSLLLVAPTLPQGLELEITGDLTSRPYVEMTLAMLKDCGISYTWNDNIISILNQSYKNSTITVEPDWSAASYWYVIAALSQEVSIDLPYLKQNSLQGDSAIATIMEGFGITSEFYDKGVKITKTSNSITQTSFDFKDCPDLAQTVVVCCAALGHNATFTGLETLKIKETDRVKALQNELAKIGVTFTEENQVYTLDCSRLYFPDKMSVSTYDDHRMAMAFAPLALKVAQVEIEDHKVVGKSYPSFWKDLESVGFLTMTEV